MHAAAALDLTDLHGLAASQGGVVSRAQMRALGVSREVVRQQMRHRRWQRALPGTYALFTGPMPPMSRVWAALLYAGDEAMACHGTAGWLHGLLPTLPQRIDVQVPHGHWHRGSRPGVRVRQSRHHAIRRHPALLPPRSRVEDTVLDLADEMTSPEPVIGLVLAACQQRKTTHNRLRDRLRARARARWRKLLKQVLSEVREGVASALERSYRRDVEVAHGLPRGQRNLADPGRGRRRYRDVRYRRWRTVVELDGRAAHPEEWRERDDLRDGQLLADEDARTVRLGWIAVTARPCETAALVAKVLRRGGWSGAPRPCGPSCRAA